MTTACVRCGYTVDSSDPTPTHKCEAPMTITVTPEELETIRTALVARMNEATSKVDYVRQSEDTHSYSATAVALDYWTRQHSDASNLFFRLMRNASLIG